MARVLLTGMSGAGKSTLLQALAARGHRMHDLADAVEALLIRHCLDPAARERCVRDVPDATRPHR